MTLKKIDEKIKTFTSNRTKLQQLGHEIAVMIFMHAAPKSVSPDCVGSGDTTRILALAKQMPKSWQVQLENWCKEFSPIRFNVKNEKHGLDPAYKKLETQEEKEAAWNLEGANETPFYEMVEPDMVSKQMSLEDLLKLVPQLATRISKKMEEDLPDGEPAIKPEARSTAQRMVDTLQALNFAPAANNDTEALEEADKAAGEAWDAAAEEVAAA